jgi:hypothetical protein
MRHPLTVDHDLSTTGYGNSVHACEWYLLVVSDTFQSWKDTDLTCILG